MTCEKTTDTLVKTGAYGKTFDGCAVLRINREETECPFILIIFFRS